MKRSDESLTFPDADLRDINAALHRLAAETVPPPAFTSSVMSQLLREAMPQASTGVISASRDDTTGDHLFPALDGNATVQTTNDENGDLSPDVPRLYSSGAGVPTPAHGLTRRAFLVGSAAVAAGAVGIVLRTRSQPTPRGVATAPPVTVSAGVLAGNGAQIVLTRTSAQFDDAVGVRLTDLPPQQVVTLRAEMMDDAKTTWQSTATFVTDNAGTVDVGAQQPQAGTYTDVDAVGLFWSMKPVPATAFAKGFTANNLDPRMMTFAVEAGGATLATATLERRVLAAGVTQTEAREQGLIGTLFAPADSGPLPAIIIVSGGGESIYTGALLAAHGFATFTLAYTGIDPLPPDRVDIPLEYFETAIGWLQAQAEVNSERIGIVGDTGARELPLLLGATFPSLKAIVSYLPSGIIGPSGAPGVGRADSRKGAWTYQGAELPFTLSAQPDASDPAIIPVEKINGPVLLLSIETDRLQAQIAVDRLAQYHHPYPDQHVHYPIQDQAISLPYVPHYVGYSQSVRETQLAAIDAWDRMLTFLGQSLS